MKYSHIDFMTNQLVDSKLASTREFWREKVGFPPEICKDPHPIEEILSEMLEKEIKDGSR